MVPVLKGAEMRGLVAIGTFMALGLLVGVSMYNSVRMPQDLVTTSLQVESWKRITDYPSNSLEGDLPILVVGFRSSTDLVKLSDSLWYSDMFVHSFECRTHRRISEGFNATFDKYGRVGSEIPRIDHPREYHLYVALLCGTSIISESR